jgi:hypothetical protein
MNLARTAQTVYRSPTWSNEPIGVFSGLAQRRAIETTYCRQNPDLSVLQFLREPIAPESKTKAPELLPLKPQAQAQAVLESVKQHVQDTHNRKALAVIYDAVDAWFEQCRYDICDILLDTVKPEELNADLLVGLLTITSFEKAKLTRRDDFFCRMRAFFEKNDPVRAKDLLEGLE